MLIQNPILKGFHPDPSIVRVGDDYYLATSTFEWWPGVRLHHSRDLKNWELIEYPLNRMTQLDLRGVGASQGVWAPSLTYDKGIFYLVYTVVTAFYCNMYDTNNYLVTTADIHGPWSEPTALNNFGFDPSLFHDDDGRKYMVSMVTDHRVPKKYAGRLVLQEYDPRENTMVGPVRDIYQADTIFLEGPHIFKRGGWYYLFSADTGTGESHGQTIQRSRNIWGPYEMYKADFMHRESEKEAYSILTSRHHRDILLQKSGHCDIVETPQGEWYAVHLCARAGREQNPADAMRFPGKRRYPLGRETAIQKMRWTRDGWLVLDCGCSPQGNTPFTEVEGPDTEEHPYPVIPDRDDFINPVLALDYQSLRIPMDGHFISLDARPGWLRMYGRSGLSSRFSQSLVARRWTSFSFEASTKLEFEPELFKQMAGLIFLYDTDNYLYLHISRDEDVGKCISILRAENKSYSYPVGWLPIRENCPVILKGVVRQEMLLFYYGYDGEELRPIGEPFPTGFLSDEACLEGWFTGAMTGICCQDLSGFGKYADFDWFEKKDLELSIQAPFIPCKSHRKKTETEKVDREHLELQPSPENRGGESPGEKMGISVYDWLGRRKAGETDGEQVILAFEDIYEEGDTIQLSGLQPGRHYVVRIDDTMDESLIYVTEPCLIFEIPFGEKKKSYNTKSFTGRRHYLTCRPARDYEIQGYRNLAKNVMDQHGLRGCFPHVSANVETRGESVFAARNAIDGVTANRSHGSWPYESWGINKRQDAEMLLEFGCPVNCDRIVLWTRADFPHDNWWIQARLTFSDGSAETVDMEKSLGPHVFSMEKHNITWIRLDQLIQSEDPSPFPALTQIEVYGAVSPVNQK